MPAAKNIDASRKHVWAAVRQHIFYTMVSATFLYLGYESQEPVMYILAGISVLPALSTLLEIFEAVIALMHRT